MLTGVGCLRQVLGAGQLAADGNAAASGQLLLEAEAAASRHLAAAQHHPGALSNILSYTNIFKTFFIFLLRRAGFAAHIHQENEAQAEASQPPCRKEYQAGSHRIPCDA